MTLVCLLFSSAYFRLSFACLPAARQEWRKKVLTDGEIKCDRGRERWMQMTRDALTLSHYRLCAFALMELHVWFLYASLQFSIPEREKITRNVCTCWNKNLHSLCDFLIMESLTWARIETATITRAKYMHSHKCDCTQYCSRRCLSAVVFYHSSFVCEITTFDWCLKSSLWFFFMHEHREVNKLENFYSTH